MRALVRAAPPLRSIAHPSRQDFTTKAVSAALGAGNPARSRGSGGRQQQQQQHRRSTAPRGNEEQRGEPPRRNRGNNWSSEDSYGGSNWEDKDRDDDSERQMRYPARPSRASFEADLFGEPLYGVAPVLAALSAGRRTPHALLLQEGMSPAARKDARALSEVQRLARQQGVAIRSASKHELNMLTGSRPHQGMVLDASPLTVQQMDSLPTLQQLASPPTAGRPWPVWLALDEVVDPQNLGAMLRSAYCLGASGVLVCARNCAPLSPTVSKASAGALELMQLHSCRSMPRTLADAAEKGWAVVGAAGEDGAMPLASLNVERPTLLVMGSEGAGLRATVRRCCTQLVRIDMAPPPPPGVATAAVADSEQQLLEHQAAMVDSLNVSVAAGILLHHLLTAAQKQ